MQRSRRVVVGALVLIGTVGAAAAAVAAFDRSTSSEPDASAATHPSLVSDTAPTGPTTSTPTPITSAPPEQQLPAPDLPSPQPVTATPALPPTVERCRDVSAMSVEQLAHLVQMVRIDGGSIAVARLLTSGDAPFGGLFIGGGVDTILADGSLAELVGRTGVLVAVDDEGGRVQRIDGLVGVLPSAAEMGAMTNAEVRNLGALRGRQLRAFGITTDFAPVADLAGATEGGVIGDRSFGTDAAVVTERAKAFADGLRAGGITPTFKHFPGHGATAGDSHKGVVTTAPLRVLEQDDLLPYAAVAGPSAPDAWVMMGHLDVPGLTEPNLPASLSPAAHRYLREQVGFDGLIVSDELGGMRAVRSRYGVGAAAVLALSAGTDLLLFGDTGDVDAASRAVIDAVGRGSLSLDRLKDAATEVQKAGGC